MAINQHKEWCYAAHTNTTTTTTTTPTGKTPQSPLPILTFRGLYIVIYSNNKTNEIH